MLSNIELRPSAPTPAPTAGGCGCGGCGCGGAEAGDPQLDARAIGKPVRHAAVLGALGALRPGEAVIVVAPRNPARLRSEVKEQFPGAFEVTVVEASTEAWKVRFARV